MKHVRINVLGEIKIMSEIVTKQCITDPLNMWKCRWQQIIGYIIGLRKTSSTVLSGFIAILFSLAQSSLWY